MITLTEKARERDSYVVPVSFNDSNGDPATPNSGLTWTLTDALGNVINSRLAVSIAAGAEINIVLSGLDLALDETDESLFSTQRKLLVEGTYNSATYGNNLPLKVEIAFEIEPIVKLTGVT